MKQPSPDDRVRFRCPRCVGKVSSPVSTLGLYVSCPHCEARVRVPIPADLQPLGMTRSSIKARQYAQIDKAMRAAQAEDDKSKLSDQTLEPSGGAVVDFGIDVGPVSPNDSARDAVAPREALSFAPSPSAVPGLSASGSGSAVAEAEDDDPEKSVSETEVFLDAISSDLDAGAASAIRRARGKGSLVPSKKARVDPLDEALDKPDQHRLDP